VVPLNRLWGHAIQKAKVIGSLRLHAADALELAVWAVLVDDNGRRGRWRLPRPTPNALQDRTEGLVNWLKTDTVALTVKRYKASGVGKLALKRFEHIAGNGQIEHLLFFRPIGPNHDCWLVHAAPPALAHDHQGVAIRRNIRAFQVSYRENIHAGG